MEATECLLNDEVRIVCVTAKSFPAGIMEAFETLEKVHPSISDKAFYGISYMNAKGEIVYKAAAEENFEGEGEQLGLETFVIPKGEYLSKTVYEFLKNPQQIGEVFRSLLADPRLDTTVPCVERYKGMDEVQCMVKIKTD